MAKNHKHSIKTHTAKLSGDYLIKSQFLTVNQYEHQFKQDLANLAGKIMDEVVRESYAIVRKKKMDIKKALVMDVNELNRLTKIVNKNVLSFIATHMGVEQLTDEQIQFLRQYGIDPHKLSKEQLTVFDIAYKHGMYVQAAGRNQAKQMNLHNFEQLLRSNKFLPLDDREKASLNSVKMEAAKHIKGLGNKWNDQVQTIMIEADKKKRGGLEKIITDKSREAIEKRSTIQQFASDLGHATKDWSRDLIRNAHYILHDAHEKGSADEITRIHGEDARVYKYVYPGACPHCIRLFLTNGEGSKPIVFTLSELQENGSNIGRKVKEWKPTIPPTHPYCRCELEYLNKWDEWDEEKGKFVKSKEARDEWVAQVKAKLAARNGQISF